MRTFTLFAILVGLNAQAFAADVPAEPIATKGRLVCSDDFNRSELGEAWKVTHAKFDIVDGVLKGEQTKPDHGAVAQVNVGLKDLVIELKFQLNGTTSVNAVLDDDDYKEGHGGHLCRVTLRPTQIFLGDDKIRFRHDIEAIRRDPARKAEAAKITEPLQQSIPMKLEPGQWYKLTLEIVGDLMRVSLDDRPVGYLKSEGIAHPVKGTFHFTVSGPDARFDDLKIWAAAAPVDQSSKTLKAARRPNILLILGDNLGKDWFGCYGSDEQTTPNIDRLAAEGVRFKHCYTTALCSTTRVELYTGRYGFRTGWHTHHDSGIYGGGGFDPARETCFARILKNAGYATCITGKWQINDLYVEPEVIQRHGFDEHLLWTGALIGEGTGDERWKKSLDDGRELESRYWDPINFRNGTHEQLPGKFGPDVYLDYLVDFMERNRERPFLAYYSCPLTHIPVVPTPTNPDKGATELERFAGMVKYMDGQIARLVGELERLKLRDDTIIVFLTDNGTSKKVSGRQFGERAVGGLGTLSENGLDVPLIVNCPARVPGGRVSATLSDCSDILPTLVEFAGAELPKGLIIDGHSLAAEIENRSDRPAPREWIFTQYHTTRVVRDRRFKLYSTGRMFDVAADPLEKNNLTASDAADVVEARRRLEKVLASLPADAKLPFEFRSSSAFKLQELRKN